MSAAGGRAKILSIQYLRAVAAMAVVVYHCELALGKAHQWPADLLAGGVDVFFVISGFVMWITTFDGRSGPRDFLTRRVDRIVPLYWIATFVALVVAVGAPAIGGATNGRHVFASFLFVPALNPDTGNIEPLVSPGWTLNYEMFFYLVFAASLLFASIRLRAASICAALVGLVLVGLVLPSSTIADFYTSPLLLEFLFGVGIAIIYNRRVSIQRMPAVLLAAGALTLLVAVGETGDMRFAALGIPAATIVGAAVLSEIGAPWREQRVLLLLGDASYSIYLSHGITIKLLEKGIVAAALPDVTILITGPVIAAAVGCGVYWWIERPITDRLRRRRRASRALVEATA